MGHYIKVTGRGYLKAVDSNKNLSLGRQSLFSKQLTLSYCADSESEADILKQGVIDNLENSNKMAQEVLEAAVAIHTFPEMFKSLNDVMDFIHKRGIDKSYDQGSSWHGLYSMLTQNFVKSNFYNEELTIERAMEKFNSENYYGQGFDNIKRECKSIATSLKLLHIICMSL